MDRLYRSRDDRMLAGVAGGLAELWDADPSLIRIIWALLVVFTGGIALIVYIVMAIVVPEGEPGAATAAATRQPLTAEEREAQRAARAARRAERGDSAFPVAAVGGLILIGLGAFFLLREFLPEIDFDWVWPLILIGIGVVLLVTTLGSRSSGPSRPTDAPPSPATPSSDPGSGSTQGTPPPDAS